MVGFFAMIGALIGYKLGAPIAVWLTVFLLGLTWSMLRIVRPPKPKTEKWYEREGK